MINDECLNKNFYMEKKNYQFIDFEKSRQKLCLTEMNDDGEYVQI